MSNTESYLSNVVQVWKLPKETCVYFMVFKASGGSSTDVRLISSLGFLGQALSFPRIFNSAHIGMFDIGDGGFFFPLAYEDYG